MLAEGCDQASCVEVAVHTRAGLQQWTMPQHSLGFDDTRGSPWLLVPPAVRSAFDVLVNCGTPLADTIFGPPMLGVKSGCNDAFIVRLDPAALESHEHEDGLVAVRGITSRDVKAPPRQGRVERALLRPALRGETLARWTCHTARSGSHTGSRPRDGARLSGPHDAEWIIWTHDDSGTDRSRPCRTLPPHAARWLGHWRQRLAARSDTRGQLPWWTLFRTESASATQARVVWPDLARAPRAALIPAGDPTVPLNTCYVSRASDLGDAQALTALLNSAVAAAWLNILAEPARGGYRRYLGWTVGLLPLPQKWEHARSLMAPMTARAVEGSPPSEACLIETVAAAYGLEREALRSLLAWAGT